MTTRYPRIAVVAPSLDILGGQGVQADALVGALRADGYQVDFVPINPRFPRGLRWVRRVPYARTIVNEALFVPSLFRTALADVVHVFSASYVSFLLSPAPAMTIARLLGKRVVLHYHSGEADDHLARWGMLVHPWLKLADVIAVPSAYLSHVFASHGYQIHVIHNIVDLSQFTFRPRRPLQPRLLSTRNLEPHYRVDLILEAFALLRRSHPDATLTIAGYGSEEQRLKRRAGAGVHFAGKVAPHDMPRLCDDADIFVNASVIDNQPVSILEAFAAGLPVVSTPTGDIPAMVRDGQTGLLVEPESAPAIASAVGRLLRDPATALAMAERAHREVSNYTWPRVRDQWAAIHTGAPSNPSVHVCDA